MKLHPTLLFLALAGAITNASARVVDYELLIEETTVSPAGTPVRALTVNGGIPGPILRFTEGDVARVLVRNGLRNEEASIHWHGLLVPNSEDGVPYLTTPPILPGKSRTFEFPLKHSGTYWYHSHTGLQEQRGVYGGIVIDPKGGERVQADRDLVLVLSDWTNENPREVMRTLMRGSDWYSIRKGTAQSIVGAIEAGHLKDYLNREKARLPPMDVSDVAYDAFLVNGRPEAAFDAKPGEKIRLRVINAAAATYFYLNSGTGPLTLVSADGMDVAPIRQNRLLMGMAETYDLLFTVPASGAWEVRATAQDGSGKTSAFIGTGERHAADDLAPLNAYSMNIRLAAILDQLDETDSLTDAEALAEEKPRPLPPYKRLRSVAPTTLPTNAPVRTITLRLNGDMARYLWSINGKTLKEESTIPVKRGEVLRLELRNDTMMHHPMHLHGHFFRLLMPDGAPVEFAPLKHTVDVPPMSRRIIEFYANEEKDWFFHCHLLYHMDMGMARVFSYDDQGPDHKPDINARKENPLYFMLDGTLQTQMSMGMATLMNARNNFNLTWEAGLMHERDDEGDDAHEFEHETDLTWQRYLNPRWSTFAGYRFTNMEGEDDSAIGGAVYRLPYNVDSMLTLESEGDARLGLAKELQLTSRLSASARVEYDTSQDWMWMAGSAYTLTKRFSLTASYDSDYGFGGGVAFRF